MIGLATIGQSPRDDVVPVMFSPGLRDGIRQAGALDGLSTHEITDLQPREHEHPLVTRLATGEEVVIAKERVVPLMESAVGKLEDQGARLVCILCTGEFNLTANRARLVYPDRLAAGVVNTLLPSGRLGVVIPHAGQTTSMRSKWSAEGREVLIEVLSPYQSGEDRSTPLERLAREHVDMVVLDCMGYGLEIQRETGQLIDAPVVLSNRLVGSIIESMTV